MHRSSMPAPDLNRPHRFELSTQLARVSTDCSNCGSCVQKCPFLRKYGSPKAIAGSYDSNQPLFLRLPFECHLCELCTAVCPEQLNPAALFLEMRRAAFDLQGPLPAHRKLRRFEQIGTSRRYTWYGLPPDCDTVFFPGCALAGNRPQVTLETFDALRRLRPTTGIVLDCCMKPSHDLGDAAHFQTMFDEMKRLLLDQGVRRLLVACPNCLKIFNRYGKEFEVATVYEMLAEQDFAGQIAAEGPVVLHDPCSARFDPRQQQAVRRLLARQGFDVQEPLHSGRTTLCCGKGAGVDGVNPEQARGWVEKRIGEAAGLPIVSYCASCVNAYGGHVRAAHVLDLLYPGQKPAGKQSVVLPPCTYLNRLQVKKHLRQRLPVATDRERGVSKDGALRSGIGLYLDKLWSRFAAWLWLRLCRQTAD